VLGSAFHLLLRQPLNQPLRHLLNQPLRNLLNQPLRHLLNKLLHNLLNKPLHNLQSFLKDVTRKTTRIVFLLDTYQMKQTLVVRFGYLMVKGLIVLHCGESALEAVIAAEKLYALVTMNTLRAYHLLMTQIH
jgi:hypothetical protein